MALKAGEEIIESPAILGQMRYQQENLKLTSVFENIDGREIKLVGFKTYRLYDETVEYYGIRFYTINKRNEPVELVKHEWGEVGAW